MAYIMPQMIDIETKFEENMTTSKEDLIQFCRYYKGEKECPKNVDSKFWEYEKVWVELSENPKEGSINFDTISSWINDYIRAKLGQFESTDGVPATLKALLFNRYIHWMQTNDGFKEWYKNTYKKEKG